MKLLNLQDIMDCFQEKNCNEHVVLNERSGPNSVLQGWCEHVESKAAVRANPWRKPFPFPWCSQGPTASHTELFSISRHLLGAAC